MTRFAYHPRLWRKHLLQHHIYSALDLPELGLLAGETSSEEALWRAAMEGANISEALQSEARRQYEATRADEPAQQAALASRQDTPGAPYRGACKLAALFSQSAEEAGVRAAPDFEAAREQLFWNILVEFGAYYGLVGAGLLRDVVRLFREGTLDLGHDPTPDERTLLQASQAMPPDVWFEVDGHARRALELYGPGPLAPEAHEIASVHGRFALHFFKNVLRYIIGGEFLERLGGVVCARDRDCRGGASVRP